MPTGVKIFITPIICPTGHNSWSSALRNRVVLSPGHLPTVEVVPNFGHLSAGVVFVRGHRTCEHGRGRVGSEHLPGHELLGVPAEKALAECVFPSY